jgi:hypothetical protein
MGVTFPGAAAALADRATTLIEEWLRRHEASRLRMPRPIDLRTLVGPARGIVSSLAQALAEPDAGPGSQALRETERLMTFAGGNLGMVGAATFDVIALVCALRDTLVAHAASGEEAAQLARLFDWLGAVAVEGYASSRLDALRVKQRDALEKGTPVLMITRELPAALLVGEPERAVLDTVFGRLLLAIVRVGARVVIVDGGGLVAPGAPEVLEALAAFGAHRKIATLTTLLTGLPPAAESLWLEAFPRGAAALEERFDDAVARATQIIREKGTT